MKVYEKQNPIFVQKTSSSGRPPNKKKKESIRKFAFGNARIFLQRIWKYVKGRRTEMI